MNNLLIFAGHDFCNVSTYHLHYLLVTDCKCRSPYPQKAFLQAITENGMVMFDLLEKVIQRLFSGGLQGSKFFIFLSELLAVQPSIALHGVHAA